MLSGWQNNLTAAIARRLAKCLPAWSAARLHDPVFVVGFNNCGKSTAMRLLNAREEVLLYPGEGNGELWFQGFFPWIDSDVRVGPIWVNQTQFLREVVACRPDAFLGARAHLGAYQWLNGGRTILNDSGMLAALAPDIVARFPDGRFIHFLRDGRLSSYLTARIEWTRIMRSPRKYLEFDCPIEFHEVLEHMARYWAWTVERMDEVQDKMPGRVLELRYEDWWNAPEKAVESICDFLQLQNDSEVAIPEQRRDLSDVLLREIRDDELALLNEVVGPTMQKKGYELDGRTAVTRAV